MIKVLRHPRTKRRLKLCGYHIDECVGIHPGTQPKILYPNHAALCLAHYATALNAAPLKFDNFKAVPGVVFLRKLHNHQLIPPNPKRRVRRPRRAPEPKSWLERIVESIRVATRRKATWVVIYHRAATKIQALFRRQKAVQLVGRLKRARGIEGRVGAAVTLQCVFRRLRAQRTVSNWRTTVHRASRYIQRAWYTHVFWKRLTARVRLSRAARCIQRWYRAQRQRSFVATIKVQSWARAKGIQKHHAKSTLTRVLLGFLGRRACVDVGCALQNKH